MGQPANNRRFTPAGFVYRVSGKLAGGLLRREDALVYRAGLLNKTGPVEVRLRDKLNNFAHLLILPDIANRATDLAVAT